MSVGSKTNVVKEEDECKVQNNKIEKQKEPKKLQSRQDVERKIRKAKGETKEDLGLHSTESSERRGMMLVASEMAGGEVEGGESCVVVEVDGGGALRMTDMSSRTKVLVLLTLNTECCKFHLDMLDRHEQFSATPQPAVGEAGPLSRFAAVQDKFTKLACAIHWHFAVR
ncbi:hypothetical protein E2C01_019574 [Portunus trituberculatus]|uniref:Uncharacterized protein n=1 Tax=Portunus trituberculatus TaxID=210409 RepID=A0A5B7DYN6_PORTR|nr:hypothetical protein [Portunus trituberculatus]